MAINPDDFIFHSNMLFEQLVMKETVDVVVSGNLTAGQTRQWTSSWYDTSDFPGAAIRGKVYIPGSSRIATGSFNTTDQTNAIVTTPMYVIYNTADSIGARVRIEQELDRFRAVVEITNPYGTTKASSNRTYTFYMRAYLIQKQIP